MKLRRDTVFISSVLFSISFLILAPHSLELASTWRVSHLQVGRSFLQNYLMPMGFAALTFIIVGLIVTWTGYVKRERSAWLVMFVMVWVFAFPVYVLPVLLEMCAAESINWHSWFWDALKGPGISRTLAKTLLDFILMLIALFSPVTFFFRKSGREGRIS